MHETIFFFNREANLFFPNKMIAKLPKKITEHNTIKLRKKAKIRNRYIEDIYFLKVNTKLFHRVC